MAEGTCPPGKKCGQTKRKLAKGSGKVIAGQVAKVVGTIGGLTLAGLAGKKVKDELSKQKKGGSVKAVKRKK